MAKKTDIQMIKTAEEATALVDELHALRDKAKLAKEAEEACSARVKAWLKEHNNSWSGNEYFAELKTMTRESFDKEKLLAELPESKRYLKTTEYTLLSVKEIVK